MYEKMLPDKVLGDNFAKTINYKGIHNNFCLDIPEILEEEKKHQEKRDDIAKFTKLVISDMYNLSHELMVKELFSDENILEEYEQNILSELSTNEQLLSDIGLI